ncbi:MAG TPA: hypothetical protein VN775_10065 [Opitutaceae bacterium]|nr:hypothetical protein [Opitutaceae bacterium]
MPPAPSRVSGCLFVLAGLSLSGLIPLGRSQAQDAGDLDRRLQLSSGRLSRPDYAASPLRAIRASPDWPGDFPGRLILAWTELAGAAGRVPPELKQLVDALPGSFNARGYLGPPLNLDAIDEQQLSGHGWLISGLCRYAALSGDRRPVQWVATMIRELALPLRGSYRRYPRTAGARNPGAGALGTLTGRTLGGWKVSTDVGCAYIFLEGLVAAYRVLPSPELAGLIDEAGESFLAADVESLHAQTHASLCAARNLLLYEEQTGMRHGWLPRIEAFYRLYRTRAMTENEANWNWFGRPATWTEPCGVVDSFLLTLELWRVTGEAAYLGDAQRIFYNGLGYGQKPHGGFGCDSLAGAEGDAGGDGGLGITNRIWDVTWCCNMRGACGLAGAAAARADWRARDRALLLPFYSDGAFRAGGWELAESTGWPTRGEVQLRGRRDPAGPAPVLRDVGFFVPAECPRAGVAIRRDGSPVAGKWKDGFVLVRLPEAPSASEFEIEVRMGLPLRAEIPHNASTRKDVVTLRYGFLLLGTPDAKTLPSVRMDDLEALGDGRYRLAGNGLILEPLCEMPFTASTAAAPWRAQVLFRLSDGGP